MNGQAADPLGGSPWAGDLGTRWVRHQRALDAMHQPVSTAILNALRPVAGMHVVDIGCGAGALSFEAARAVGGTGRVTGLDISQPLLAHARALRDAAGLSQVDFVLADVEAGPLKIAPADMILSRFGVMFFDDPVRGFSALRETLRPGGQLIAAVWDSAARNPWFAEARAVAEACLGPGAPGAPHAPGPMALADPERSRAILHASGFVETAVETRALTLRLPGGVETLLPLLSEIGPIPALLREKSGSEVDRAAILEAAAAAFSAYLDPAGTYALPASIHLIRGTRP